ncbi:MAG TPA: condensation domain-containing protein, partial [Thermoanaerobaculia bacterium]|nr:condensation domain-containing protein [Thermoanaerobaculia bacterium]
RITLAGELPGRLEALGRRAGATVFMTLLAAFQALLHRYAGQDDIVVGSPIANRNRLETEPLIGYFANTVALRTDLSGNPSFRELLARVREAAMGAYAHQDVPFERVVEELRPARQAGANPFFRVMFVLLDAAPADAGPPGLELSLVAAGDRAPKFDLTLWAEVRREELRLSLTYDEDLFDAAAAAGMLDRLGILLARVAEDPGQPLLDVPLAAADEEPPAITPPPAFVERFAFEA